MKTTLFYIIYFFIALCSSCTPKNNHQPPILRDTNEIVQIYSSDFQELIDSIKAKGCILIYDVHNECFYSNDYEWANMGQLPASTFKIPNSIIGLELGILKDSNTILPWNGERHQNPKWEKDLKLKDAFQLSCVPCYRKIARQIGLQRMLTYTDKLNFGNMSIDSSNIDMFWLTGDSRITPFEEIDFLKRFNEKQLPISEHTYTTMKFIMLKESFQKGKLYGKTGWSNNGETHNFWFVGFMEFNNSPYYFATNLSPISSEDITSCLNARISLTKKALQKIGVKLTL